MARRIARSRWSGGAAREQQAGDVRARDEQHRSGQTLKQDQRPLEAAAQGGVATIAGLERERLPQKGFAHFGKTRLK